MHYVRKSVQRLTHPGADVSAEDHDILLVVEKREAFVSIKRLFVNLVDLPDRHGNGAVLTSFYGQIKTRPASFEQKLPVLKHCRAEDRCVRAAHPHLLNIEVAAVGDIVSLFHVLLPSF